MTEEELEEYEKQERQVGVLSHRSTFSCQVFQNSALLKNLFLFLDQNLNGVGFPGIVEF